MIEIEKIGGLYDPKTNGLNYTTFMAVYKAAQSINERAADSILIGLRSEVSSSRITGNGTLSDYLYGRGGFFDHNPEIYSVIFMNGKFHSKFSSETDALSFDLETLAKEYNSLPFQFHRSVEVIDSFERELVPELWVRSMNHRI
ncbi:MAG TPA: hypothetical protein VI564_05025 [Candidatus Nanoarchaeia archaeon]|nr:hypothetical protein [Candidatus Nanoarchaeia archaeon]